MASRGSPTSWAAPDRRHRAQPPAPHTRAPRARGAGATPNVFDGISDAGKKGGSLTGALLRGRGAPARPETAADAAPPGRLGPAPRVAARRGALNPGRGAVIRRRPAKNLCTKLPQGRRPDRFRTKSAIFRTIRQNPGEKAPFRPRRIVRNGPRILRSGVSSPLGRPVFSGRAALQPPVHIVLPPPHPGRVARCLDAQVAPPSGLMRPSDLALSAGPFNLLNR